MTGSSELTPGQLTDALYVAILTCICVCMYLRVCGVSSIYRIVGGAKRSCRLAKGIDGVKRRYSKG